MLYRVVHAEPDLAAGAPQVRDLSRPAWPRTRRGGPPRRTGVRPAPGVAPAGESPDAFWPAPVALIIADHQARFAAGLMAGARPSAEALTVPVAPATPPRPATPATPPLPVTPATPPLPGTGGRWPAAAGAAGPGLLEPVPGMGRLVGAWRRWPEWPALAWSWPPGNSPGRDRPPPGTWPGSRLPVVGHAPGTKLWSYQTNGTVASGVAGRRSPLRGNRATGRLRL